MVYSHLCGHMTFARYKQRTFSNGKTMIGTLMLVKHTDWQGLLIWKIDVTVDVKILRYLLRIHLTGITRLNAFHISAL